MSASRENAMLAQLPRTEREHIERQCTVVQLAPGTVLSPADAPACVWFPTGALIAEMVLGEVRETLAVRLVGSESLLGASFMLGGGGVPLRLLVQDAGSALFMEGEQFRRVLHDVPRFERMLRLHLHVSLAQYAQIAMCAAYHLVPMRVAFWLLETHDRSPGDRFYLTQDLLAHLLGVRRSGVTAAALMLQQQGLIMYTRGRILVVDRKGLERASCTCHEAVRAARRPLLEAGAGHHPGDEVALRRIARAVEPRRPERGPVPPHISTLRR